MTAERLDPVDDCFWTKEAEVFDFICPQCRTVCEEVGKGLNIYFCEKDYSLIIVNSQFMIGEPIHGQWEAFFNGTERLYYTIIESDTMDEAVDNIDFILYGRKDN